MEIHFTPEQEAAASLAAISQGSERMDHNPKGLLSNSLRRPVEC